MQGRMPKLILILKKVKGGEGDFMDTLYRLLSLKPSLF